MKKFLACFEVLILISFSFAIAGILSEQVGIASGITGAETQEIFGNSKLSEIVYSPPSMTGAAPASVPNSLAQDALDLIENAPSSTLADAGGEIIGDAATKAVGEEAAKKLAEEAAKKAGEEALKNAPAGAQNNLLGLSGAGAHLANGLIWGGMVAGIVLLAGNLLGLEESMTNSLALASFGGIAAWQGTHAASAAMSTTGVSTAGLAAPLIGIGVGVGLFVLTYKKEKTEIITFECLPWEAPTGMSAGEMCEDCNSDPFRPCSEYRCKSISQSCELVNQGTESELCVFVGKDDTESPIIQPWDEVLGPGDLRYTPDNSISPPNKGVKIIELGKAGGCLDPWTQLQFGITTNEPAQCKVDWEITDSFGEMNDGHFGESNVYAYNHTQKLRVPSPLTEQDGTGESIPEIHTDGTYTLWTRCRDAMGNENVAVYGFRFCVDPAPDTSAPIIENTSIVSGKPVRAGVEKIPIEVYTDEPSSCRWSRQDKAYDVMENEMDCDTESYQINVELNYVCRSDLTGIIDEEDNNFYFRCKDKPWAPENDRYVMSTSFPLLLRGTEKLVIEEVGPSGTIKGGVEVEIVTLTAKTLHGANEGVARCGFSDTADGRPVGMQNSNSYEHSQDLDLEEGIYTYYFTCTDAGGNTETAQTTFTILIDRIEPEIARIFKDASNLKIITTEDSECMYSSDNCLFNFEEGLPFSYEDPTKQTIHVAGWDATTTYYVKCRDKQGNPPAPDECTIVAKGTEF